MHNLRSLIILLLAFFGISSKASAQSVPFTAINRENYGVTISSPMATEISPRSVSNLSCILTNHTSKPVVGYVVLWTLWPASGAKSTTAVTSEASQIKSSKMIQPGQSFETYDPGIEESTSPVDPFVRIYVLFADGSRVGKDTLKLGERMSYGRQGAIVSETNYSNFIKNEAWTLFFRN